MSSLTSCPLLYLLPCRNLVTPIRRILFFTNRASLICWVLKYFWWRWGESNSRPEHFSSCFTQPFTLPYNHYTVILYLCQIYFICLYCNRKSLNPSIQSSRFSTKIFVGLSSIPIIITSLPTGIPVSSSNATAYAAVCIK